MGKVTIFFFTFKGLSSVWLLFYQRSDTALLLGISPDSWLAMFHSQRCSYIRTDDPSTKAMARRAFTVSWNVEVFVHSRSVVIFPQAPPSLVSSPSKYPPSFVALAFNKTKPALSSIAVVTVESHQTYSSYQLVAYLGTSTNAVSRHLDKNRAKHRRTVFSMKKAQKSKQRSTNWRRRHLGDMQQQPRRWPGFDKCVETKLRWDVYIRPWPPGWSFWRRIYTSRGSERVKRVWKALQSFRSSDLALFEAIFKPEKQGRVEGRSIAQSTVFFPCFFFFFFFECTCADMRTIVQNMKRHKN